MIQQEIAVTEQSPIIVFPRGQLSQEDKASMRGVGVIAVEADDPKLVMQVHLSSALTTSLLSGDAIVRSALQAIAGQPAESDTGRITSVGRAAHSFIRMLSAAIEETKS